MTPAPVSVRPTRAGANLLLLLDEASAQSSCVWIEGPPGAGKTTLVLLWLATRKRPCLWYQVDPGDHDLVTLCHYLGLSAEETAGPARLSEV
jgi:ATP/maltotriose-dependent transcriptional regulator MalT